MPEEITDTADIEVGDVIKNGIVEWEVVDIREEPDGFGPPFRAQLVATKERWGDCEGRREKEIGKARLLDHKIID